MKTILGLDLGTTSIGWALIEVDENGKPIRIIAMGARIIPLDSDDRDQFQKGQAISKNQDRTRIRTQRKGYDRKQLKKSDDFKYSLKVALKQLGIYPSENLMNLPSLDLWKLRSDSANASENITPEQLGRILYMLNQKRGYKSARSEANQDKKDTDYVAEVKGRYAQLKETEKTLGQFFYEELLLANNTNSYFRTKEKVYPREAYTEEFDKIMSVQKDKHSFLTDDVIHSLRDEIIYYQRKLKSQKGLVSVCEFEGFETIVKDKETQNEKKLFVGPRVAPKTSPLFQLCKIWEVVNNISLKIKNPEGSRYKWAERLLTLEEKRAVVDYLNQNESLSFPNLLKILKLQKDDVYANKQITKGIQGNLTYSEIQKVISDSKLLKFDVSIIESKHEALLIDKRTGELLDQEEAIQLDSKIELEPLYQLWHTIYSIKDLDECKNALMKKFGLDNTSADKLSRIDFNKQSFGNKSNKAMRKIIPYLMKGYDYSQACNFAGYNHSNSLTKEEKQGIVKDERLSLLPKNSLRQPVVEKIINQMINVVNAIIDKHCKPDEIRVELARELKQSKDERSEADAQSTFNKKLNEEIAGRLNAQGLPATKRYIQKYKFIFPARDKKIKESQVITQCIYCGKNFSLTEALSGDSFDVDHIVPKALLFDDSQMNKVLVHRSCNSNKLANTAYDYIAQKGQEALNEYLIRVDDWFKRGVISYGKMQRLKVSFVEYQERKKLKKETEADKKLWEHFIDRQLRQTQFIARKSVEILNKICSNVTVTEGNVTARLRNVWGWDDVLMNLQLPKYKALGKTFKKEWTSDHGAKKHSKEEIENWSKRDDHRHHAIDALVIACTKQGFIQRINTLNASEVRDEMNREVENAKLEYHERLTLLDKYLLLQKPFTTSQVEKEAEKILVSFKAGKKVATNGVRKVKVNGMKKIVQTGIIVPRGGLHEQFVYGRIKIEDKDKPLKYLFENPQKIINTGIKTIILERLKANNYILKDVMNSLKKNPIYLDEKKEIILEKASCFKEEYVIKYKIQDIKSKDVPFIIDSKVRNLVKTRLDEYNGREKEAFKDVLWFNEEKQIPILSVRCLTGLTAVEPIKKNAQGNAIGFAKTGSNHHVAVYNDMGGKPIQHICTFWHAVERKKYKIPYIIKETNTLWDSIIQKELPQPFLEKLPPPNLHLQFSMQQNEMFILGLGQEEVEECIKVGDNRKLSEYLYLVWSLSDNDFWFRHHLETKNSELKNISGAKESYRFHRFKSIGSLLKLTPIKVRLNHLGEITKIGE